LKASASCFKLPDFIRIQFYVMKNFLSVLALGLFLFSSCEQNTHVKTTRTVDENGNTVNEKTTTTKEVGPDKDRLDNVGDKIEERAKEVGSDIKKEAAEAKADYKERRDAHDTIVVKKETTHTTTKKRK
jgi:hypothetical protein